MAVLEGPDPFEVDPELDLLLEPDRTTGLWSETMYFQGWDPEQGVGFWWHSGRWMHDVDLWWAQIFVYLPDGQVVTDRSFGRPTDRLGPATGNMRITCDEPGKRWTHRYDGAGELTTSAKLGRGLGGAGKIATIGLNVETTAIMPTWDLYKLVDRNHEAWAQIHHQQALRMTGEITVDGRTFHVEGPSYRDHSSGPRDWTPTAGAKLLSLIWPSGRVVIGVAHWRRDGGPSWDLGLLYENDRFEVLPRIELPPLDDIDANPREFDVVLHRDEGDPITISGRALHSATLSFEDPNHNLNGVDLTNPSDPIALFECPVEFTWPDGEVGHGNLERDHRVSALDTSQAHVVNGSL